LKIGPATFGLRGLARLRKVSARDIRRFHPSFAAHGGAGDVSLIELQRTCRAPAISPHAAGFAPPVEFIQTENSTK